MQSRNVGERFDPFRRLSEQERRDHLAGYLMFMREIDGDIDVEQRALARRELRFAELQRKPVESRADIDTWTFQANLTRAGSGDLDRKMAWLVVAAKANTGESYGVDRELAWITRSGGIPTADELYLRMLLQEGYHTRILLEVCRTAGLEEISTPLPNWNQRMLINVMMRVPESIRWCLVMCGEIIGCAIFETLLGNCDQFSDEPEVEARLRSLLGEILRDEALHVAYLRARLSPFGLGLARRLLPFVARAALLDLPQLRALGATPESVLARLGAGIDVPPEVTWFAGEPSPAS